MKKGDNRQRLRFWLIFSLSTSKLGHSCAWSQSILAAIQGEAHSYDYDPSGLRSDLSHPSLERNKRIPTIIDPPLRTRWSWHLPWTLDWTLDEQLGSSDMSALPGQPRIPRSPPLHLGSQPHQDPQKPWSETAADGSHGSQMMTDDTGYCWVGFAQKWKSIEIQ